ncbi:MAG: type II secretion system protein GspK [Gammaproteobacteria bacterium]|nr:type II secretion system protein GspK [Gammaproteobacteria bacterium]MDH5799967.1 type II secretion system protein GspK [Gammaproteobacteria bacterium]
MGQKGTALVIVLWVVALLSMVSLGFSKSMSLESRSTGNLLAAARDQYHAEAGLNQALLVLLQMRQGQMRQVQAQHQFPWHADGQVRQMQYKDSQLSVSVLDERARIDLNYAPVVLLQSLLVNAGVSEAKSTELAHAIADWRDSDHVAHAQGAEDDAYAASGLDYGAKDAPFQSVAELLLVRGMTTQVYHSVQDSLTVYSGQSMVSSQYASEQVRRAMHSVGLSVSQAAVKSLTATNVVSITSALTQPHAVEQSRNGSSTGTMVTRGGIKAVVRLHGAPQWSYSVLEWQPLAKPCLIIANRFNCNEYES